MNNNPSVKQIINALVLQARSAGLPNFVLGFKFLDPATGKYEQFVHFENIQMNDAVNLSAFAWRTAIDTELKNHPDYTPEWRQIFLDAQEEFLAITKKVNARVEEYRAGHSDGAPPSEPAPKRKKK